MGSKISVVMASYLGEYTGCAKDRVIKFHRAVESFIAQDYENKELIIISDGCALTISESRKYYLNTQIFTYALEKQPMFSGGVRNMGISKSSGDIVCYLDTDDYFGENHLSKIVAGFNHYPDADWLYYNDFVVYHNHPVTGRRWVFSEREVDLRPGDIGTSSVAHLNKPDINWVGCDGYGHDWTFIERLIESKKSAHKHIGEYYVCHIPMQADA